MRDILDRLGPPGARANAAAEAARRRDEEVVAEALAARMAAREDGADPPAPERQRP
jgi:hypothetical protein